jgi:hypothetical protein
MPPLIAIDPSYTKQISASYIKMHGERISSNGIDITATYRRAISDTKASDLTLGAALLGSILDGEMDIDSLKRDVSGVVIHVDFDSEYLVMKKHASSLILFVGIPISFGNFIIEDEEDVTVFNIMTGLRGGARLGLEMGDFTASPVAMVSIVGGYTERYTGGVYLENLNSGGIPIFAVSGDNNPIDTAMIQLGFSF